MSSKNLSVHEHRPSLLAAVEAFAKKDFNSERASSKTTYRDRKRALLGTADLEKRIAPGFFEFCRLGPEQVNSADVQAWIQHLRTYQSLKESSIYAMLSRLSSFFNFLMQDPDIRFIIPKNPVDMVKPKAPRPYNYSRPSKPLSDEEIRNLLKYVFQLAEDKDNITANRDATILLFYLATGQRRNEIIALEFTDIQIKRNHLIISSRTKGNLYHSQRIDHEVTRQQLIRYLKLSHRWDNSGKPPYPASGPIWLRHDNAATKETKKLNSQSIAKNLKQYAAAVGIANFHIHRLRHTIATITWEETGNLQEVAEVLHHQELRNTRLYINRVATQKDKVNEHLKKRINFSSHPELEDDAMLED